MTSFDIACDAYNTDLPRIYSAGLRITGDDLIGEQRYPAGSVVPNGAWSLQDAILLTRDIKNPAATIYVRRLEEDIYKRFDSLRAIESRYETAQSAWRYSLSIEVKQAIVSTTTYLKASCEIHGDPRVQGINISETGLLTASLQQPPIKRYVGLHCDSHLGRPLPDRESSPLRLCFNLGHESRYFLFLPILVTTMQTMINAKAIHTGQLLREYILKYPESRVFRLRIDPGEIYIAPTYNMMHDATTVDMHTLDLTYSMVAKFERPGRIGRLQ